MNTKKKLNCYVFSNLIVSLLSINMLTNNSTTVLVKKNSVNTLNKIYDNEIVETVDNSVSEPINNNNNNSNISNVIMVSNKVMQSEATKKTVDYVKPSYNSLTGASLVSYAKQFIGLPYISAGRSLATGTDCSGFTSLIYKEFGITLGRTVASQLYSGTYVSRDDLKPGDLVFYSYGNTPTHVTIYIGNGLIIHESNPRDGVKISSINIMKYITARRLITQNIESKTEETKSNIKVEETIPEDNNSNTKIDNNQVVVETEKSVTEPIKEEVVDNKKEETEQTTEEVNKEIQEEKNTEEINKEEVVEESKEDNNDNVNQNIDNNSNIK